MGKPTSHSTGATDDPQARELAQVLIADPSRELRIAAAQRCDDLASLVAAWKVEADPEVRAAIGAALTQVLAASSDSESLGALLSADHFTDEIRSAVAAGAADPGCRRVAIASIRDARMVAVLIPAGDAPSTASPVQASESANELPTGVVTFLFTDIEGSTRLWETHPEAMQTALGRHDVLLRDAINDHHGSIFKTGGDAFYAVFSRVADAVRAALAGQRALHAERWPPGAHIKVRIALNTGEAHLRDSDYYGPPLNRVARVLSAGHGGQTLLTLATHDLVAHDLPSGASTRLLGEYALKDLPQPQPIYQLCESSLPAHFAPLRTWRSEADETVPSIAVLPFRNMSRDEENEYFADGLSEELLNVLSRIKGLRVASRTSSFKFKGNDIDVGHAAQTLGVAHVLAGSVRKAGKRVRISAELVKVSSDSQLWSDSYDRELDDIFAVQDDIAQSVVQELRERLLQATADASVEAAKVIAEVQAASKGRSDDPEAFRLYLQGQFFRGHLTKDSLANAVECYEHALGLDGEYALAWAGLSRVVSDQAGQNWVARDEGYERARTAALKAIELEPTLPEGHTALGWVLWAHDWNWAAADASFQAALKLAPGSTLAINAAATLVGNLGSFEEAIGLFRRAVQLDPLNVSFNRNLGLYSLAAGYLLEAETALNRTLQISPQGGMTHCWRSMLRIAQERLDEALVDAKAETSDIFRLVSLAVVHWARGEREASDAALDELIRTQGADSPYQVAEVFASRGQADAAFEWLERTYADRDPGLSYMKMDPLLANVRADPRWTALLAKMQLG
jgi:TolB-like protein/class 3 adenylate cyclase/Tfp pilus assembly protein PilF